MNIWIIGASSGIGRALSLRLVKQGWQVAASARNARALMELAEECRSLPGELQAVPCDVTEPLQLSRASAQVAARFGPLDCVLVNAGSYQPTPFTEFGTTRLRELCEVNLFGVANALELLMPQMLARGRGQILVTASLAGYRGLPNASDYCASKAAVIALVESLQPALAQRGVRLRLVNPGFVRTRLTDLNDFHMPALITPEQAAAAIERGLGGSAFEIDFPRRFSWWMKLLRVLPDRAFLVLSRRLLS